MKYEIVIRNLETGEERRHECGEYAAIAMTEEGKPSMTDVRTSADHLSDVMMMEAPLRAAGRLAVAKYEAGREIRDFENKRKMEKLADIFAGAVNED